MRQNGICYLLMLIVILLYTTCKQEDYIDSFEIITLKRENTIAALLFQQMNQQSGTIDKLNEQLLDDVALYEDIVLVHSSHNINGYIIPCVKGGVIVGCIVYSIEEVEGRLLLTTLIRIEKEDLDVMFANDKCFLSAQFLEWERKGTKIISGLTSFAKELEVAENESDFETLSENATSVMANYYTPVTFIDAYIDYKTTYTSFYDPHNGYISVKAPDIEAIMNIMERELANNNQVVEVCVNHNAVQQLYVKMSLNTAFDVLQFKSIIKRATDAVNSYYYSMGGVAFSTYYTYKYTTERNESYGTGRGTTGLEGAFSKPTHPPLTEDEPDPSVKWTLSEKKKELNKVLDDAKRFGGLDFDGVIVEVGGEICGSNALKFPDKRIEVCDKAFRYLEHNDRVAVVWHEVFHINYDTDVSPLDKQTLRSTAKIANIPDDIKAQMREYANIIYQGFDFVGKDQALEGFFDNYLYVDVIHNPLYYENEINAYKAEINTIQDVSHLYDLDRNIQLWIKEQYWKISKQRWR